MPIRINLSEIQNYKKKNKIAFRIPNKINPGRYGFLVLFKASQYPLHKHFCYMIPRIQSETDKSLRRFVDMDFSANLPGIPVGPWPGWRFIPELPNVTLRINDKFYHGRFNFWGDEIETKQLQVLIYVTILTLAPEDIELEWADVQMSPIAVTIFPSVKQKPASISTELKKDYHNIRPRLFFSPNDIDDLQNRKNSTHRHIWNKIIELKNNWHLEFELTKESKTLTGPERLDQQDRVVISSFIALMTKREQDIKQAQKTFFQFLDLTLSPDYEPMQIDTQSGECLFTACIGYDWLWMFLNNVEKTEAEKKLFTIAELVWNHLGYSRDDYAQAHFLDCSHGLLAFSFLFWQEYDKVQEWVAYFHGVFIWILKMLPEDGFYPHGINLWIYEHIFLLRYLELFRQCTGINFWNKISYWKNASLFRTASICQDNMFGITFGDPQYRVCGDAWVHFLIASRTHSEYAQCLGSQLESISTEGVDFRSVPPRRRVWEYIFYNPQIKSVSFARKSKYFDDGGQIFWRSENASNKTLITFRANGLLGKSRYQAGEWSGYGHSDPCNGSFLIKKNDSFLFCGPGPVYRRDTLLHNTITIDDRGQIGDGLPWAPEFIPKNRFAKILDRGNQTGMEWITADLTPCYLDFLGVQKCIRQFIFIRPCLIIVYDQIQLKKIRNIQWNVHSYGQFSQVEDKEQLEFLISDKKEQANLICLSPESIKWKTDLTEFVPAYPHSGERDQYLQLSKQGKSAQFLTLINLGEEQIIWKLLLNLNKKSKKIAKIIYANNEYII